MPTAIAARTITALPSSPVLTMGSSGAAAAGSTAEVAQAIGQELSRNGGGPVDYTLALAGHSVLVLEKGWGINYEGERRIVYERIELIKPENDALLLEDLRARTGLNVKRFEIDQIDFLRDTAQLTIYFDYGSREPES